MPPLLLLLSFIPSSALLGWQNRRTEFLLFSVLWSPALDSRRFWDLRGGEGRKSRLGFSVATIFERRLGGGDASSVVEAVRRYGAVGGRWRQL